MVELECGHEGEINTSRYRVSRDLRAILLGSAAGRGVLCRTCGAIMHPIKYLRTDSGDFVGSKAR